MEINVAGEHAVEVAPEFARVHFTAQAEGADKVLVARQASELANRLASALHADEAVSALVVEPIQVNTWTPSEGAGQRHGASVTLSAEFSDAAALAEFQAAWAGEAGVQVGWVDWALRPATEQAREAEVLAGALASAQRRARHIADAAGRGALTIVQVSDPGLSSERGYALAAKFGGDVPAVDVRPVPARISARLEVRFRAE